MSTEEDTSIEAEKKKLRARSLVAEVTDRLHKQCQVNSNPTEGEEIVVEGHVAEDPDNLKVGNEPDIMAQDYDAENGVDKADALSKAINGMKGLTAFDPNDIHFFFNQVEIKMQAHGVLKQFTKLQVLTTVLPQSVLSEIKPLLSKKESEFVNNDAYLQVKTEIIRIFAPSEDVHFDRAMGRVLSDTPSSLARALVNDLCEKTPHLQGCCCRKFIGGLWKKQLPSSVRAAIADTPFNADNFNAVLKTADNTFKANKRPAATIAMITPVEATAHDTAFSGELPGDGPEIAAYSYGRGGGRGGRGQGRGGRGQGGRGRGGNNNRGGQNQGVGSAQGGSSGSGGGGGQNKGTHPRHKTKRHADQPPFESCWRHWTHGKSAHFCMEPATCPWKEFWVPKSNN